MKFNWMVLITLLQFTQASFADQYGKTHFTNNSCHDSFKYSTFKFKQFTFSTDPGAMFWGACSCIASYVYAPNRRNRAVRKEQTQSYEKKSSTYFSQKYAGQEKKLYHPKYTTDPFRPYYVLPVNPLFEQWELYRFSNFQKALFAHHEYEESILEMERRLSSLSQDELKPPGYYVGELETIIHYLADNVRETRIKEDIYWEAEYQRREKEDAFTRREAARQEALRKAKQIEDREKYRQKITRVISDDIQLFDYCNFYNGEVAEPDSTAAERYAIVQRKRKKALSSYNHSRDAWKESSYKILDQAQKLLNSQSVKVADYAKMYGNKIQRVLHKEFVMLIHETADMRYVDDAYAKDRESVANTLIRFIETGEFYNRNGSLGKAFSSADFCWGLLDCFGYILSSAVDAATDMFQITVAASKGVVRGCVNFDYKIFQPIRSVEDLADQIAYLRDATWEHLKFAHEERTKNIQKLHAKILKDEYDLKTGKATRWDLLHRDMAFFNEDLGPTIQRVHAIIENTRQLQKDDVLYGVEKIAEAGTEMFLTNQAISGFGQLLGNSAKVLENCIDAGNGFNKFHKLPLNGQTLQAAICYEAVMAEVRVTAPVIGAAGVAVEEALEDAAYIIPFFLAKSNGGGGQKIPKWLANVPKPNGDILNIKQLSNADEANLSKKYDGVCSYNGVPIYFRYDHNWNGDINTMGELGGMHQDILGHIESQGLIYKSKSFPEKFYRGYAYSQGQWHNKSWFPQKWLVDDVMQSVFETIKNPNYLEHISGIIATLEHKRSSGVIIRVVLNIKTGKCLSFYPRL